MNSVHGIRAALTNNLLIASHSHTQAAHSRAQRSRSVDSGHPVAPLSRRGLIVLAALVATVCIALLAASTSASSSPHLVMLSYRGRHQLEELASQGLRIINYQENVLAAICSERETAQLVQDGFRVRVLAPIDTEKHPYLVYPQVMTAPLTTAHSGGVYSYTADSFIIQVDADEAEALAIQGADIVRLPTAITLSARPVPRVHSAVSSLGLSIESMLQAVSPTLLVHHVCKLQDRDELGYCNELGTRYSFASTDLAEAAEYLFATYESYGLNVTYDPFVFNSRPMTNVVAELPGSGSSADHIFILSAHYDSISQTPFDAAPGADDNASGVAAVLEVARILSKHSFPCTICFVNFAGEEQGLLGSAHYAQQAAQRGDLIHGVLNLDMIAYESVPPGDHQVDIHAGTDMLSIGLADTLVTSISDFGLELVPQVITAGATWRSDHGSFWSHGFPALLGIEDMGDFNPYYHSTRDTRSRIHPQLMTEFTKASLATLARLAAQSYEPPHTPTPVPSMTPTTAPVPTATLPPATPTLKQLYLLLVHPSIR